MPEAQVATDPPRIQVVTNETMDAYVNEKLGIVPDTPEQVAAKELEKVEAEKAERIAQEEDATHDVPEVPKDKKDKLNERFSKLATARKAAEEAAAKAIEEAKQAKAERDAIQQERDALKTKYEPPKSEEIGPEPLRAQFKDDAEYIKALKDHTAEKTRFDDAREAHARNEQKRAEKTVADFRERQEQARKDIADFDEVIKASNANISNDVRDAIIESDVGPQLLYHLAKHPEIAEKIKEMSVARALREIGRLEGELSGTKAKPVESSTVAEISKAPAPITPLKNASNPVVKLSGSDPVPSNMSYDDWKALRKAGKIR